MGTVIASKLASNEEQEAEEVAPAPHLPRRSKRKRRLASALRIKKPATPNEREVMIESLEAASQESSLENYQLPSVDLLLASAALPGLLPAVHLDDNGYHLDGGVVSNIPPAYGLSRAFGRNVETAAARRSVLCPK